MVLANFDAAEFTAYPSRKLHYGFVFSTDIRFSIPARRIIARESRTNAVPGEAENGDSAFKDFPDKFVFLRRFFECRSTWATFPSVGA